MATRLTYINNCQECPFCNFDNEQGPNQCNAIGLIADSTTGFQMPKDKVDDNCPLKNDDFIIKLKI